MSPLLLVVFVLLAVVALLVVAGVWAMGRIRSIGFGYVQPATRTIDALPRELAIPTAHRKRHPSRWS